MKVLLALLLLLFVHQCLGIKVLQDKDIPKDYAIGNLMHIAFGPKGRMFFRST